MTIKEIYQKLNLPEHLQQHMLTVTKLCIFIADHWKGNPIDKDQLVTAALLHDVGNIVKPKFLGDPKDYDEWKKNYDSIIAKYGSDDHVATEKMLNEFGVDKKIIEVILNKSGEYAVKIKDSDNWTLKILYYADSRVSPKGITTIKERFEDLMNRLEKYKGRYDLLEASEEIEIQIQKNVTVQLHKINEEMIKRNIDNLLSFQF
jgi:HD superfamily phosphohydrolase YqeK